MKAILAVQKTTNILIFVITFVVLTGRIRISGVGLRETIHGKLDDGGVMIPNSGDLAGRMASYLMSSKAETTNKKYFGQFNRFNHSVNLKVFKANQQVQYMWLFI